jgi:hypothetical protein
VAQPQAALSTRSPCRLDEAADGSWVLHVNGDVDAVVADVPQLGGGGDVRGQIGPNKIADASAAKPRSHDAVVIEYDDTVGGDPRITLESGSAEAQGEPEGVNRVLRSMGLGPAMGEGDGRFEQGRESAGHLCIVAPGTT